MSVSSCSPYAIVQDFLIAGCGRERGVCSVLYRTEKLACRTQTRIADAYESCCR